MMDLINMRTQYEGRRIQINTGTTRLNSRRVIESSLPFWKESHQQYRNRSQESKLTDCGLDAIAIKSFAKEIKRITKFIDFPLSQRNRYQRAETMRRPREYLKAAHFDSSSMAVNFFVIINEKGTADITSSEIIDFTAKLFFLAAKRGRVGKFQDSCRVCSTD